jgi:hypothetical protein
MNLADVSQTSQTSGSAAVVASRIFVGVQIRHNTTTTRAVSHHAVSEALNLVNLLWARDSDVTMIWLLGMSDRRAFALQDRWRFDSMIRAYLHVCETMYTQAALGAGDSGIVVAEEAGTKHVFLSHSLREWWSEIPFGFLRSFDNTSRRLLGSGLIRSTRQ